MILTMFIYVIAFIFLFPPILKYRQKNATIAFFVMFGVALTYSILSELNVPMENVPLFFSRLLREWGIAYPPVYQ